MENNPLKNGRGKRKKKKSQIIKKQDSFAHWMWPCKARYLLQQQKYLAKKEFTDSLITDSRG